MQYNEGEREREREKGENKTILMMFVSVACLDFVWTVFSCYVFGVDVPPGSRGIEKQNVLLRSSWLIRQIESCVMMLLTDI